MYKSPEVAKTAIRAGRYNSKLIDVVCLSSRERKIIVLIAEGLTYREIGQELGVSQHTMQNQTGRMLVKRHVSKRSDLSDYASLIRVLDVDGTETL